MVNIDHMNFPNNSRKSISGIKSHKANRKTTVTAITINDRKMAIPFLTVNIIQNLFESKYT